MLVAWELDRLGRNLAHLVHTVQALAARGVGLRVLVGQGAQINTTTAAGRLVFGICAWPSSNGNCSVNGPWPVSGPRGYAYAGVAGSSRCRKPMRGFPRLR